MQGRIGRAGKQRRQIESKGQKSRSPHKLKHFGYVSSKDVPQWGPRGKSPVEGLGDEVP